MVVCKLTGHTKETRTHEVFTSPTSSETERELHSNLNKQSFPNSQTDTNYTTPFKSLSAVCVGGESEVNGGYDSEKEWGGNAI